MTEAAYTGWKADMLAGKVTLMAAATNATVTDLSARARADRVLAGQVEADGAVLHDGNLAGRGDWVATRHNDRRMSVHGGRDWVKNSDAWQMKRRHPDGSPTVRSMAHGGRARLPAAYVAAEASHGLSARQPAGHPSRSAPRVEKSQFVPLPARQEIPGRASANRADGTKKP